MRIFNACWRSDKWSDLTLRVFDTWAHLTGPALEWLYDKRHPPSPEILQRRRDCGMR